MNRSHQNRKSFSFTSLIAIALLLAALAFATTTDSAAAQETETALTEARLNLREGPGRQFIIMETLDVGTEVEFTGFRDLTGDWLQVQTSDGQVGWVAAQFLSKTPDAEALAIWQADEAAEEVDFSPAVVTTTTTANLNIREGPGTQHAVLETLPQGAVVGFTGFMDGTGEWVQVDAASGPLGWVAARFLSSVPQQELQVWPADLANGQQTAAVPVENPFSEDVVTTVTIVNLNIRQGPGTEFQLLDTLPAGTIVGFTGFTDESGEWVHVDAADGPVGWVAARFLSTVPQGLAVWEGEPIT